MHAGVLLGDSSVSETLRIVLCRKQYGVGGSTVGKPPVGRGERVLYGSESDPSETVLNREEITAIEALMLMREEGKILHELFDAADSINERINNNVVTYVRSKQIYYTNICRAECSFCSFYRKKGAEGGVLPLPPPRSSARSARAARCKQVSPRAA